MHKELKKSILVVLITTIILIGLLYIITPYIPKVSKPITAEKQTADLNTAKDKCIALCILHKGEIDYSKGPCLSDEYEFKVDNWVCDIAHNPRIEIDNKKENQCKEFGKEKEHFIEVDENCEFIRAR